MDSVLWSILRLSFVKMKFDSTLLPISFVKGYYFTFCYGFYLRVHPSQKTFISSDSNTTGITSRALPSYINGVPSSSRVLVDQDIVFYVVLYLSFFLCISVIVWPLCCLSFALRLLITIFLVSSSFSASSLEFHLEIDNGGRLKNILR